MLLPTVKWDSPVRPDELYRAAESRSRPSYAAFRVARPAPADWALAPGLAGLRARGAYPGLARCRTPGGREVGARLRHGRPGPRAGSPSCSMTRMATIALGPGTHDLLMRFLSALPLRARPRLVTTDGEFHSVRRQLDRLAEEGIEVGKIAADPAGTVAERLARRVDDRDRGGRGRLGGVLPQRACRHRPRPVVGRVRAPRRGAAGGHLSRPRGGAVLTHVRGARRGVCDRRRVQVLPAR